MIFSWCPCFPGYNRPPHKQDGPWSWVVLLCGFLHNWLFVGFFRSYGVLLPVLMVEFNEGREKIALISSLRSGITFLMTFFSSWLCSRFGANLLCGVGYVVVVIGLVLSTLVHNVNAMFLTFSVLIAFGISFINTASTLSIVKYFKTHRSLALGINSAGGGLGVMTMPIITQYMLDVLGWRKTLRVQAGFFVLFSLMALVLDPNVEEETDAIDDDSEVITIRRRAKRVYSIRSMLDTSVWKVPKFVIAVISASIALFGMFNTVIHLAKFSEEIGISAVEASTLYIYIGLTSIIFRVVTGRLCDFACINSSLVMMFSEILAGVCAISLTFAKTYAHLVAFSLFQGVADGTLRTTTNILLTTSVRPFQASSAFGQGYSVTAPFLVAGPAIAGLMADTSGSYVTAFYMSGGVLLGAAAVHILPACIALGTKASLDWTLPQAINLDIVSSSRDDECEESKQKCRDSQVNPGFE